jgi:hypothetical protein
VFANAVVVGLGQWRAPSRRVEKIDAYPPLSEMDARERRELHEALLEAGTFEDLPGKWQAAILTAEENRPKLRLVGSDYSVASRQALRTTPSRAT